MNRTKGKERWIHCYKSSQKILLVGEGDFSFSASLARAFHTAENIVATSYLKRKTLLHKHWTGIPHLEELESLGCLLLYKVDVYKMHTHPVLKSMKFDIIIYNFPHAGHYESLCERDPELIEMHMNLVEAYFQSASKMLTKGGEVHLRHRDDPPYDSWNVVSLARKAGLTLKEKQAFEKSDYPGYHNKRGGDINTNKTFPITCAYTYKFIPDIPEVVDHHYYDLLKKDEAHVLEMNNQVHDDEVQVLCEGSMVYDHVNVSNVKEENQSERYLKPDKVDSKFQEVEVDEEKDVANVDLPKNEIVVDELDLHVLEMVDVCEHGGKIHKVDDNLLKEDDRFRVDVELLKDVHDGHLLKKDEVDVDLYLTRVDDDHLLSEDDQVHVDLEQLKVVIDDGCLLKKEVNVNSDLPRVDNVYLPKNDIVVDKHDLHVLEMVDVCELRAKNNKVDDDLFKEDYHIHVDLELLKAGIDDGYFIKKDDANVDPGLSRVDDDYQMNIGFQDLLKKDDEARAIYMKDQDNDPQHFINDEVKDHFQTSEEMDYDFPKMDEVDNNLPNKNEVGHDDLPKSQGVNDAYLPKNEGLVDNNHEVDHVLIDIYDKEMKDEMKRVHSDLYDHVLEMMDHLQMQQTEHNLVTIQDKVHGNIDDDDDVAETKEYVHQDCHIEAKKDGIDGYHNSHHPNIDDVDEY